MARKKDPDLILSFILSHIYETKHLHTIFWEKEGNVLTFILIPAILREYYHDFPLALKLLFPEIKEYYISINFFFSTPFFILLFDKRKVRSEVEIITERIWGYKTELLKFCSLFKEGEASVIFPQILARLFKVPNWRNLKNLPSTGLTHAIRWKGEDVCLPIYVLVSSLYKHLNRYYKRYFSSYGYTSIAYGFLDELKKTSKKVIEIVFTERTIRFERWNWDYFTIEGKSFPLHFSFPKLSNVLGKSPRYAYIQVDNLIFVIYSYKKGRKEEIEREIEREVMRKLRKSS